MMKKFFISIYLALILGFFSVIFGVIPITHELFEKQSDLFVEQMAKGTFSLISEQLIGLDEKAQHQALSKLQAQFGYPIRIYEMDAYPIDPDDLDALMQGRILDEDEGGYVVMQRLGTTDKLLVIGDPFPFHGVNHSKILIVFGLCFLFLTLPALLWSYALNRDMERIETSGAQLLSGDHGARAMVSKLSSLFQISSFFNTMAEKFQTLLAAQKELTNNVSHEIRTPLSRIQFSLAMLSELDEMPQAAAKHILRITKDADEIEALVDEMLTYAQYEGKFQNQVKRSDNDIMAWLKTMIREEQNNAGQVSIVLKTELIHPVMVCFDPISLERAFRNLIRNGHRYAKSKVVVSLEIKIGIDETSNGTTQGNGVLIHIEDDGSGIDQKDHEKIFQPFYRVDSSRNRESGGYGLGLAIAKKIILRHGGSIRVSSSSLGGARFSISL